MFNLTIGLITLLFFAAFMTIYIKNRSMKTAGWTSATFLLGILALILQENAAFLAQFYLHSLAQAVFLSGCICAVMSYAARAHTKPNMKIIGAIFFASVAIMTATSNLPLRLVVMEWASALILLCGYPLLSENRDKFSSRALFLFNNIAAAIFVFRPMILIMGIHPAGWPSSFAFYAGVLYLTCSLMSVVGANIILLTLGSDLIEKHQKAAMVDPLTGLLNRRGISEIFRKVDVDAEIDQGKHTGRAVLLFDVDHFKQVNDEFGHEVGDTVLTNIGHTVTQLMQYHGISSRSGGEEFMIVFTAESSPAAFLVAEHLRVAISLLKHEGMPDNRRITASFGLAFVRDGEPTKRLIRRADVAMYAAKDAGRNRLRLADGDSLPDVDETVTLPRVRRA